MTVAEFIESLKIQTSDSALFGTVANLQHPPGRKPREHDVMLSSWYGKLSESDRGFAREVMREAAELAVFSFLCILDGVSAVENGPDKGRSKLIFAKNAGDLLLNDPNGDYLHDLYNAFCRTSDPIAPVRPQARVYETGSVEHLRSHQTSNDGIDLHAIGGQRSGPKVPAIALPKNEHRKLPS